MTSTVVKDSIVGDKWIYDTAMACPVHLKIGDTGQPTGDIITGPVRLAFTNDVWDGQPIDDKNPQGDKKYPVTVLFTPYADMNIFMEEYYKGLAENFANCWNAQMNPPQYVGVHSPFHDQAEKSHQYMGFTPGCTYLNCSSMYKPPIVDIRNNPIVDKNKVYAGVWAICALKKYPYGLGPNTKPGSKKGIGFGIQTIMLLGDDTRFGGGAPDTKTMYAGINVSAPIVRPDALQGMPGGGAPAAPPAGIPGYTQHGPGATAAPQYQTPAPAVQHHTPAPPQPQPNYAPPQAPQNFTPPGAPAASHYPAPQNYAPGNASPVPTPATQYPSNPGAPQQPGQEDTSFLYN